MALSQYRANLAPRLADAPPVADQSLRTTFEAVDGVARVLGNHQERGSHALANCLAQHGMRLAQQRWYLCDLMQRPHPLLPHLRRRPAGATGAIVSPRIGDAAGQPRCAGERIAKVIGHTGMKASATHPAISNNATQALALNRRRRLLRVRRIPMTPSSPIRISPPATIAEERLRRCAPRHSASAAGQVEGKLAVSTASLLLTRSTPQTPPAEPPTRIPLPKGVREGGFDDWHSSESGNGSLATRRYSAVPSGSTTLSGTPWVLGEALAAAIASAVLAGMPPLRVRPALTGPSSSWPE